MPGRKRCQIEAFAGAAGGAGKPVLDWCGGKGHLGRLLALNWAVPVTTLEIDAELCAVGGALARRAGALQDFVVADALTAAGVPAPGHHAVALHACGHLHRRLVREGAAQGASRLDVAPCCYHLGMPERYEPLASGVRLELTRDDARLAVTESVTAVARERRQSGREMAWKLAFVAWRESVGSSGYRNFKPVPSPWMRAGFAEFIAVLCRREGLPTPGPADALRYEAIGWQRRDEVLRLSVVRHAFRRALEVWLVLDLAVFLAAKGYEVALGTFCPRRLTPRNLMLSAEIA
ncbi:MAG: methyltransferase [Betaproteobacteria bacterium]|nr:methyltransferase [Betaproteobacteria bacterium]